MGPFTGAHFDNPPTGESRRGSPSHHESGVLDRAVALAQTAPHLFRPTPSRRVGCAANRHAFSPEAMLPAITRVHRAGGKPQSYVTVEAVDSKRRLAPAPDLGRAVATLES